MPSAYLTIRDGGQLIYEAHVTSTEEVHRAMFDHQPTRMRGSMVSVLMEIPGSIPFDIAKAVPLGGQPVWGTEKKLPRYRRASGRKNRQYRSVQ